MKRTPLKRSQKPIRKISPQRLQQKKQDSQGRKLMLEWFLEIWDEREDKSGYCYCFETGKPMHRNTYRELSSVYDHVLEKQENAYPQYKMNKKNIIIILPEVHYQKGADIRKTPKINAYREHLLDLHKKNEL